MPTARPIISASTGVFEFSSSEPDASMIPAIPMPTPISAVSSGIPAASSEPNVMISTTAATATPRPSVAPVAGAPCTASPPYSTSNPAWRPGAAVSFNAWWSASVSSKPFTR